MLFITPTFYSSFDPLRKISELSETVHQDVETRIREGVKAVIEQILEEEMAAQHRDHPS